MQMGQAPSASHATNYVAVRNYDHPGSDIEHSIANVNNNALLCSDTAGCAGFNSSGYIKNNMDRLAYQPGVTTYIPVALNDIQNTVRAHNVYDSSSDIPGVKIDTHHKPGYPSITDIRVGKYQAIPGYDRPGADINHLTENFNPKIAASLCNDIPGCIGFNSDGFFKNSVTPLRHAPGYTMYTRV